MWSSTRMGSLVATLAMPFATTYVPRPGIEMPTIAPGALNALRRPQIAASIAAVVAGGNDGETGGDGVLAPPHAVTGGRRWCASTT